MQTTSRTALLLLVPGMLAFAEPKPALAAPAEFDISKHGAVADGKTVNTGAIQKAIDDCAVGGGGTLVVPQGVFVTGALFLKPGVNLELREGGVLQSSLDPADFPIVDRRIEGMTRPNRRALINAEKCDGLKITGPGTLDGNNPAVFAKDVAAKFKADPIIGNFPQLVYIKDSNHVTVSKVKFERSAFWNLHFYRCKQVLVEKTSFRTDKNVYSPSSDGVDVDSCQDAKIIGCSFDVEDDCIALKGSRGPNAWDDKDSPPTENILVRDCHFIRGHGGVSLGTEATIVRNVTIENCRARMLPKFGMLRFKIRTDTPGQLYENIKMSGIEMYDGVGVVILTRLNHGTKEVVKEPHRIIRNVVVENVTGTCHSLGTLFGNEMTEVRDITLRNINIKTTATQPATAPGETVGLSKTIENLTLENVKVNGKLLTVSSNGEKEER